MTKNPKSDAPQIVTFGCRLNSYESEVMSEHAREAGLDDAIIINSCAVTNEAVRQARQTVRRLKRENPKAKIIVTGCAAQIDPEMFDKMDEVDFVIGNDEKMKAETFQGLNVETSETCQVNDIMSVTETAGHLISAFGGRARAYVQVQNGCDHRCTFCIIPFGRGNSRSVPAGEVVHQVSHLVDEGYKEIVITGVDITAYGKDLPGEPSLGKLCQQILKHVPELKRLRISSIDSVEADDALMDVIANEERLMPHLHLSLQAGDNMILKRMKRRHSREDAIAFCSQVRELRPNIVFGADIIAGFPTETDEMFENSLQLVEECGLTFLHVFPFSPRPGTPAALMPQVTKAVIKERAAKLRALGNERLMAYMETLDGQPVELLMERGQMGRAENFIEVRLDGPYQPGAIIRARVTRQEDGQLKGEVLA
ncbi:MAG: tRNA (N(6)-L-threonylcarbamoyladenosine(37)-C(2))-methylthiotransferase MtaB [Rhizobiales bacterium]|nr:tRNA (N(6)-L-threonylcarbamoyladenosine(37)-C(2))-methylthiotransferase MtaB [Hyphomicrobiales bacterium]